MAQDKADQTSKGTAATSDDARKHGVRRQMVVDHAARLFVERGYSATSLGDIGKACGITAPAIYRHFPSKQALLASLVNDGCERLLQAVQGVGSSPDLTPRQELTDLIGAYVDFLVDHKYLAVIAEDSMSGLDAEQREKVLGISRRFRQRMVDLLRRTRLEMSGPSAWLAINSIVGMCRTAIRTRTPMSSTAMRRQLYEQAMAVLFLPTT